MCEKASLEDLSFSTNDDISRTRMTVLRHGSQKYAERRIS